jgi:outer membrane protein assembly factor BamB
MYKPASTALYYITLSSNRVYTFTINTTNNNPTIYSFNKNGVLVWEKTFSNTQNYVLHLTIDKNDNVLFSGDNNNRLYCLNAANGNILWQFPMTNPSVRPIVDSDNTVYCIESGVTPAKLFAIKDGIKKWEYNTGTSGIGIGRDAFAMTLEGNILCGLSNGMIHCVNKNTGTIMWSMTLGYEVCRMVVDKVGTIFASNSNYELFAINPNNQTIKWKYTDPASQVITNFAIGPNYDIYVLTFAWPTTVYVLR